MPKDTNRETLHDLVDDLPADAVAGAEKYLRGEWRPFPLTKALSIAQATWTAERFRYFARDLAEIRHRVRDAGAGGEMDAAPSAVLAVLQDTATPLADEWLDALRLDELQPAELQSLVQRAQAAEWDARQERGHEQQLAALLPRRLSEMSSRDASWHVMNAAWHMQALATLRERRARHPA